MLNLYFSNSCDGPTRYYRLKPCPSLVLPESRLHLLIPRMCIAIMALGKLPGAYLHNVEMDVVSFFSPVWKTTFIR